MKKLIIILFLFSFGCAAKTPFVVHQDLKPVATFKSSQAKGVREIKIKDFLTLEANLNDIPFGMPVSVTLVQPITLNDFFQLLIDQGINIVADLTPKVKKSKSIVKPVQPGQQPGLEKLSSESVEGLISMPSYNGELRNLLKSVQQSHGLFFEYKNDVLIVRQDSPAYVKVIMPGIQKNLIKLLSSFGVDNAFYDELSSRIVFKTDFHTYSTIADYFRNNGYLTLAYFDVIILETAESAEFKHGFDWSGFSAFLEDIGTAPLTGGIVAGLDGSFNLSFGKDDFSFASIFKSLDSSTEFEVLQSARVSALNGSVCSLDVSEKIPYVEAVTIAALEGSTDGVTTGYEFNTVSSGLTLNLKPTINGNLISLAFDAQIQSVNEFLEVGTSGNQIQQPVVQTRNLKNQIVFNAGDTALIGGLKYTKGGQEKSGLSFIKSGFRSNENKSFYISILIKSEVVRYVFT